MVCHVTTTDAFNQIWMSQTCKVAIIMELADMSRQSQKQPKWRLVWLAKHAKWQIHMVPAPDHLQNDVCFCPLPRIRTWMRFKRGIAIGWTFQLYQDQLPMKGWMKNICSKHSSLQLHFVKVCRIYLVNFYGEYVEWWVACINMYHKIRVADNPWMSFFLEGKLTWANSWMSRLYMVLQDWCLCLPTISTLLKRHFT